MTEHAGLIDLHLPHPIYYTTTAQGVTHLIISSNEAKDVIMTEHAGLIDLHFPHPGSLVNTGEYFDCHVLAAPLATPHLAKSRKTRKTVSLNWAKKEFVSQSLSFLDNDIEQTKN